MDQDKFDVWQFFMGGGQERVLLRGSAEEAVETATRFSTSVGAQIGTTERVAIIDPGDYITWEWQFGKGITFPLPEKEK